MRLPSGIRFWFWFMFCWLGGAGGLLLFWESQTSTLQARFFSSYAEKMRFALAPGENPELRLPQTGPYNERLGYTQIKQFTAALAERGFTVAWQMRATPAFNAFVDYGGFPIYQAKNFGGLSIYDRAGLPMYQAQYPSRIFHEFAAVPPLLVAALQFIEDRKVLGSPHAQYNPAVDWSRFLQAAFGQVAGKILPGLSSGGGSTLATQIEKFRNAPGGQTQDAKDKLRQMASASLRAYWGGRDTRAASQHIVLEYLNATPLAARPGWGEINGIGDGLWVWFGLNLGELAQSFANPDTAVFLPRKAFLFKHALALIVAGRRPAHYLQADQAALDALTNTMLDLLRQHQVITPELAAAAKAVELHFLANPPEVPQESFVTQKASNAIRRFLSTSLSINNLYELDHLDMAVGSTLDMATQSQVTQFLQRLREPDFVKSIGLEGERLIHAENDLSKINWTIVLYERTPLGNALRLQADNLDQPLDLNDGAKLDLGSTAKLRTLTSYLEILTEAYQRFSRMSDEALEAVLESQPDNLTGWVVQWLLQSKEPRVEALLHDAMQRSYSASPHEQFFTDGGMLTFGNFDSADNGRIVTVAEALRKSINLPFIRLMRDVVSYEMAQGPNPRRAILGDPDHPARQEYLQRFAANEGWLFLNQFYQRYHKLTPQQAFAQLMRRGQKRAAGLAVIFRSVFPTATEQSFLNYVAALRLEKPPTEAALRKQYAAFAPGKFNLADRAYVAGVHPLELWLVDFLVKHPQAERKTVQAESKAARLESYAWLFNSGKGAQDSRIKILLEQDAFAALHGRWQRLGYPFERLVPSLATAVGSSADRPGALAELMGIIVNDGVRLPMVRANYINFAMNTPFQTMLARQPASGRRVMNASVAKVLRAALRDVVANGTAKRLEGGFVDSNNAPLPIGGKTGTGDQRFEQYGKGGVLLSSRVVNRTATLVFYVGDRFFGSITAYVAGEAAAQYRFTSALPSQMLRALAPTLQPLINERKVSQAE